METVVGAGVVVDGVVLVVVGALVAVVVVGGIVVLGVAVDWQPSTAIHR